MASTMSGTEIDFRRLRSHHGDRSHAFEELSAQLASLEDRPPGAVFHRKGVGADAGVECLLRNADGTETGWQAKYFFALGRAQIGQLNKSIEQALTKHLRLTRFIVCIPFNLRDARRKKEKTELECWRSWVKRWDGWAKKKRRLLEIELWDETALVERLSRKDPRYEGRIAFWFNQTFLTPRWFSDRFHEARVALGERYTPETNVELPIRKSLLYFCRDPLIFDELENWSHKLEEQLRRGLNTAEDFKDPKLDLPLASLRTAGKALTRSINLVSAEPSYVIPTDSFAVSARAALRAAHDCGAAIWEVKASDAKQGEKLRNAGYFLRQLSSTLDDFLEELQSERWNVINSREILLEGEAGAGKSHLFADAAEHQVLRDRPALLILGGTLREADPWSQIIEQLGVQGISSETLLGALDTAGQAAGTRAVVFIDAINERHGIDLWPTRLASFLQTIAPYPHVAIALSCRSTYVPFIIRTNPALNALPRLNHRGFAGNPAAARYYLDKRGITRMAAPNLVPEFQNPLFLRTCCDFLDKQGIKQFPRGLRGVTSIFTFYTEAASQAIETRMKLDPSQHIVAQVIAKLATAFDEGERGYITREEAQKISDKYLPSQGLLDRSLLAQLISEGVLAVELVAEDNGSFTEIIRFTFERYSDHRIAHQLLERHFKNDAPESSFAAGTPLNEYVGGKYAYKRAGVIEAFAIQIPERCGRELQDLVPRSTKNRTLLVQALLESALWRNQKDFTRRTLELLRDASNFTGRNEVFNTLVSVATEPENSFNAFYLHDRLIRLAMPERDEKWSIYLMSEQEDEGSSIEALISWALESGQDDIDEARAELAAIALCWVFTVSNRHMRDRATKALASLFSVLLKSAVHTISRFSKVDDLYVLERLLAAAYGGALQGLTIDGLSALAETTYECVFASDVPIAHIMIRDYARGIIEFAAYRGQMPPSIDLDAVRPPYRSEWPLEAVARETIDAYKQEYNGQMFSDSIVSSAVRDGDFARYVIDFNVTRWSKLPISLTGLKREEIYSRWRADVLGAHPSAEAALDAIDHASASMRSTYDRLQNEAVGPYVARGFDAEVPEPHEDDRLHPEAKDAEERLHAAELRLRALIGDQFWQRYLLEAQPLLHGHAHFRPSSDLWPPRFDSRHARRWVCKRAHDLGWTPARFAEFDRNTHSSGRMDHRVERIGKKYQWIAFNELLARIADHQIFLGDYLHEPTRFDGPWQISKRDLDPSLLIDQTGGDVWRQWDRTWWMPVQLRLRHIPAAARLRWLEGPDDFVDNPSLIVVENTKDKRKWVVLHEVAAWHQWAVRDGDRKLERTTWFRLQSVLVKNGQRNRLLKVLGGKVLTDDDHLPTINIPYKAFLGEYPWHPVFKDVEDYSMPHWYKVPVPVQPLVASYFTEKGGYDYSISESFGFALPGPVLMKHLDLHLSDGRELSYADGAGVLRFFDPSVHEAGPSAALVDFESFTAFLKREELSAVWIIGGLKNAHGGKDRRDGGWAGERLFSSIYWMTDAVLKRGGTQYEYRRPSREQVAELLAEDDTES